MAPAALPTWSGLADQLGTTVRSLERWRERFSDAPAGRDPNQWLAFMQRRGLGHFSLRGNAPLPPSASVTVSDARAFAGDTHFFPELSWSDRHTLLFEVMEFLWASRPHVPGTKDFRAMGKDTLTHLLALAEVWQVEPGKLDREAWRKSCMETLARHAD